MQENLFLQKMSTIKCVHWRGKVQGNIEIRQKSKREKKINTAKNLDEWVQHYRTLVTKDGDNDICSQQSKIAIVIKTITTK